MKFITINETNYPQVVKIYTEGIKTGIATFETQVPDWKTWNEGHLLFGRIALVQNEQMIGFTSLSPVSKRAVYKGVAEVSVYVSETKRGNGFGEKLLSKLIEISEENNIWTLQSGIMRANKASIHIHQKCGFRIIGYRERISQLYNVWLDNIILERRSKMVFNSSN